MEFRITPFFIISIGVLMQFFILPERIDTAIFRNQAPNMLLADGLLLVLSVSTFARHDYFTTKEKAIFYSLLTIFVIFVTKYIYQYIQL